MATIEYAYFQAEGISDPTDADILFPEEYIDKRHYKNIFCPRCDVPLRRTPRLDNKTSNGKDAFFQHYQSDIECSWHTQKSKEKKYLNEEDTHQVIEDENLTVVTKWSTVPEEEQEQNGLPVYTGVNENPFSDETTEQALGRYREGNIPLPNRITSVRTIAINISAYKHKAIILPDSDRAVEVQSLLKPLDSELFEIDHQNYLFYGRINNFTSGDRLDFLNIENESQMTSIWVSKDIAETRKFSPDRSRDRVILVYGILLPHKEQLFKIRVEQLGQIAYIPKDKEKFFWYKK